MNKAFENILERLEEFKHWEDDSGRPIHTFSEVQRISKCKEIVQEVAKEYNNGWIPCSERLPEIDGYTSDTVLVCTIDGFQHMAFWCNDEKWRYCESGMIRNPMEWTEIIAWQPLPEPYKEKE